MKQKERWRKRYILSTLSGRVWLVRGRGKKGTDGVVRFMIWIDGAWMRSAISDTIIVCNDEVELVRWRLKGIPVAAEPRWNHKSV
jgi:hypothetical protein